MAIKRKRLGLMKMPDVILLVQEELCLHPFTVRKMIKLGQLPAPAIATNQKSRWWRRVDIEAWLHGDQAV